MFTGKKMKKYIMFSVILGIFTIGGCARHSQIIIDPNGVDMGLYQSDLAECRQLSRQVRSKVSGGIITGAIVGTVVGKIVGGHRSNTATTAKLGALSGGLQGGSATAHERERVVKNCLRNRGYSVLN